MAPILSFEEALEGAHSIDSDYAMPDDALEALFQYACEVPHRGNIVELGVYHGRSSAILGYVANRRELTYDIVDCFVLDRGDPTIFQQNMHRLGISYNFNMALTHEVAPHYHDEIDLLILDAGHDDYYFPMDAKLWIPKVRKNGVVIFDDWGEDDISMDTAWAQKEAGPNHNPHWAIPFFGGLATKDWTDLGMVGRIKIKKNA